MKYLFLILCFVSLYSFADVPSHQGHHVVVEKSGNIRLGGYSSTDEMLKARHYVADNKDFSKWFNKNISNSVVKTHAGAVSRNTLPVVVEHEVSKKAVMRNLFGKVSTYAKNPVVGRLGWVGLAASFVIPYVIDEFYLDEKRGAFVANDKYYFLVITYNYNGYSSYTVNSLQQLQSNCQSWGTACTTQATFSAAAAAGKDLRLEYCKTLTRKHSDGKTYNGDRMDGNSCAVMIGGGLYSVPTPNGQYIATVRVNEQREMTYEDFERLTLPAADADPSPFVNYSRDSQNSSPASFAYVGVTANSGAKVDTDPYTDPIDGKAKQTTIIINEDGKSATLEHILRPDLQGQTDVAPVPTPIPDTDSDNETKPEPTPASTPLQCDSDKYPDSLGCVDTTEEIEEASMVIPQETVPLDFQVKNYITSSTGTCPQGSQFTLNFFSTQTYEFSFEPVCKFAEMIKYALWVCSWLIAYYIVIGRPE